MYSHDQTQKLTGHILRCETVLVDKSQVTIGAKLIVGSGLLFASKNGTYVLYKPTFDTYDQKLSLVEGGVFTVDELTAYKKQSGVVVEEVEVIQALTFSFNQMIVLPQIWEGLRERGVLSSYTLMSDEVELFSTTDRLRYYFDNKGKVFLAKKPSNVLYSCSERKYVTFDEAIAPTLRGAWAQVSEAFEQIF